MPNYLKHEQELLSGRLRKLAADSRRPRIEALNSDELVKLIADLEAASDKAGVPEPGAEISAAALVLAALRRAKSERRRRGINAPKRGAIASSAGAAAPARQETTPLSVERKHKPAHRNTPSPAAVTTPPKSEPNPGKPAEDTAGREVLDDVRKAEKAAKKAAKDAKQAAKKAARVAEREVNRAARKAVREAEREAKKAAKKADKGNKKKKDKKKKSKT